MAKSYPTSIKNQRFQISLRYPLCDLISISSFISISISMSFSFELKYNIRIKKYKEISVASYFYMFTSLVNYWI